MLSLHTHGYDADDLVFSTEDARVLLRKLEEICSRVAQGAGSDYLSVLARTTKNKDEKQALQRLQVVRLALAKYYARCGVIGVGGRVGSNSMY
jgi:nuclear pore complex protein Nup85